MTSDRELIEKTFFITGENLEGFHPSFPGYEPLTRYKFLMIDAISAYWERDRKSGSTNSAGSGMREVMGGLFSQKLPVAFCIVSEGAKIRIYIGLPDQQVKVLKNLLSTSFPGVNIKEVTDSEKSSIYRKVLGFGHCARIMGTPTDKTSAHGNATATQIDALVRGLTGEHWAYIVFAEPVDTSRITAIFNAIAQEIRQIGIQYALKGTVEEENRLAKHYIELLEARMQKFQIGRITGAWHTRPYILTQDADLLKRGMSIIVSAFNGEASMPDRIRTCICSKSTPDKGQVDDILNSNELAVITQIPREEFPGFAVKDYATFGVETTTPSNASPLVIGEIYNRGNPTGNRFEIPIKHLAKHGLIVGVTGSGKTNTCFHLLSQLWGTYKIPFLVIESAKSEYRELLKNSLFKECRIFTLGDDTVAPFRLNPFEVPEGILVQSHIDYLKSLFNASFVLYAPMPYVLEQSIHEIYEERGWDLATNTNFRGGGFGRAFPTLTDLHTKIGNVVDRLGYDERISMDVKAGLKARINNLRIGGKGLMLDTRKSVSESDLFERPAILELKQFVNDEEKAFVIGLLLVRLYEYYEGRNRLNRQVGHKELGHITLIEEAHRLLKNIPTESSGEESANPKGKAVETFANILSEIRAYGEGILIAEQIPVKLTPDAIKNTNLKIVQRMVAADDREVMGETINLTDSQKKFITTLQVGEALAYSEGLHKPFLIKIPNFKETLPPGGMSNQNVIRLMNHYFMAKTDLLMQHESCRQCAERGRNCTKIRIESSRVIEDRSFQESFNQLLSSFIYGGKLVTRCYRDIIFKIRRLSQIRSKKEEAALVYCCLTRYAERSFEARGDFYYWPYDSVDESIRLFNLIAQRLSNSWGTIDNKKLENNLNPVIANLSDKYQMYCHRELLPFASCKYCVKRCLFQYEIDMLFNDYPYLCRKFDEAFFEHGLDEIADVCIRAAKRFINQEDRSTIRQGALCFAVHKSAELGLTTENQEKLVNDIYKTINKKGLNGGERIV